MMAERYYQAATAAPAQIAGTSHAYENDIQAHATYHTIWVGSRTPRCFILCRKLNDIIPPRIAAMAQQDLAVYMLCNIKISPRGTINLAE